MRLLASLFLLLVSASGLAHAQDALYQAEEGELFGDAAVAAERQGYTGEGYVTNLAGEGDSLRITFEAEGGFYSLNLHVAADARFASYTLWLDGEEIAGTFLANRVFGARTLAERRLEAGTHTLVIQGRLDVDAVWLESASYPPPPVPPSTMADEDASASARALFAFLRDQYGEHVLAAQQDTYQGAPRLHEIAYVEDVTGVEPAIGSFDLIEYSPSRVDFSGYPSGWTERWIEWAEEDGIVNLMWHWNAPTDLLNTQDQPWWRGFYTEATTFNVAEALADPEGEDYQLLLRDIDAIAEELQKFEDADVPVLWRPLHEASGTWFWWGAQGPEAFKELWRLLFDRLTNHHGLHNLIWVYTHEPADMDWYPGDEYVDVIGADRYPENPETLLESTWDTFQADFADEKLVALTESGVLPDMQASADRGIWWSWFAIWTGGFLRDLDPAYLSAVYNSEVVMTRDELPAWRTYELDAAPTLDVPEPQLTVFPNPSLGAAQVRIALPQTASVEVEVFDVLGRRVQHTDLGVQPVGQVETQVESGLAAGTYLVHVRAGRFSVTDLLTVAR